MLNKLKKVVFLITILLRKNYYGFFLGHEDLSRKNLSVIKSLIDFDQSENVKLYENNFANLIGQGYAISYAAGRMGLYSLLLAIGAKEGDEVILPGFTCSVMANAVLRLGCNPIYADIDLNTYGSSADAIKARITPKTKAIIAQHSFGIPCDIVDISIIAKSHQIFLIEDCALSLGSKVGSITLGNFGDAAIFSTDHSKPINTMTGGIVYTNSKVLHSKLEALSKFHPEMNHNLKKLIYKKIIIEKIFYKYKMFKYIPMYMSIRKLFFRNESLDIFINDFKSKVIPCDDYPIKFPEFLAYLGNIEIAKWKKYLSTKRASTLKDFIDQFSQLDNIIIPSAYLNENNYIIPYRYVFQSVENNIADRVFNRYMDINWVWFKKPIVATQEPLANFGYVNGSCPNSEALCKNIMNLPPYFSKVDFKFLVSKIKNKEEMIYV